MNRAWADRALFAKALPDGFVEEILSYMQQQKIFGKDHFRSWVEASTGRCALVLQRVGRPPERSNYP
jgi:hypothetical protein